MDKSYHPHTIENIVQNHWHNNQTYTTRKNYTQEKYYCLSMMPYPSGKLHMGHVRNYTIGDVISRYQRMLGKNVLQPIGWDAFGLPAEQAAIENNTNPATWTHSNIHYMKKQLKMLGFAYDWSKEIITCHPKYYQWEQWFFTVLYKKNLVYKKTASVNWCPYHKTVLANEQVIDNCCWRCHNQVKYKKIQQWFIKITNYADQLLDGLNQLTHWPERVKTMQRNWIGQSKGMDITFNIENSPEVIKIYITRLDIFMGITYINVSIDHPIALQEAKKNTKLSDFIQKWSDYHFKKNTQNNNMFFEKEGIPINVFAIHPIIKKKLPIWITNFTTLMEQDEVGATAAIPAHNQQDWNFAQKYNLPIKFVIKQSGSTTSSKINQATTHQGILYNSENFNGLESHIAANIISEVLLKNKIGQYKTRYRLKDWSISRQRYWGVPIPIVILKSTGTIKTVPVDQLPVMLPQNIHMIYNNTTNNLLAKNTTWIQTKYKGKEAIRDTDTFDTFVESSWYYARYTCPDYNAGMLSPDATKYWLPVDQYIGGIEHAIMHLMYFRFYHKLMRDEGLVHSDEPAIRLLCQGMVLADTFYYISNNGKYKWVPKNNIKDIQRDKKTGNIIKAIDIYGHELIYAGMCKMSKSKNNGIDPNTIVKKYGADAIRFFIIFAAPAQESLEWKESGIIGAQRFLKKIWNLTYQIIQLGIINTPQRFDLNQSQKLIWYHTHKTIEKVTDDIDRRQSFNTALAAIMKLINKLYNAPKNNIQDRFIVQESLLIVIRLLYPFTPHISFILWKSLGQLEDIDYAKWPVLDTNATKQKKTVVIVQINGKTKHKIFIAWNSNKNTVFSSLQKDTTFSKYLIGKKIKKIIYVPNKVINLIV